MGTPLFGRSTGVLSGGLRACWAPGGRARVPLLSAFHFSPLILVLGPACEACTPYFSEQEIPLKKAEEVLGL